MTQYHFGLFRSELGSTNKENTGSQNNAQSGRRRSQAAHVFMEEKRYIECIVIRHQVKPVKR